MATERKRTFVIGQDFRKPHLSGEYTPSYIIRLCRDLATDGYIWMKWRDSYKIVGNFGHGNVWAGASMRIHATPELFLAMAKK